MQEVLARAKDHRAVIADAPESVILIETGSTQLWVQATPTQEMMWLEAIRVRTIAPTY
jgi:hypothetical protein